MPRGLHVVVPGGHGVSGPAVQLLEQAFLEQGSVEGLDVTVVEALGLPRGDLRPPRMQAAPCVCNQSFASSTASST